MVNSPYHFKAESEVEKRGVLCNKAGVSITLLLELVLEPAPPPGIVFTSVGALKNALGSTIN